MSRLLLIAVCCLVAAICLFDSAQGAKTCLKQCKASCGLQHRLRNRNLKRCEQKCQALASVCKECTSPSRCRKCLPGQTLVNRQCVGTPAVRCLAGLQVLYVNQIVSEPQETIKEFNGGNNSINYGFDGFVVWLTALWQSGRDGAVSGIDVVVTETEDESFSDVSKGDGSNYYRYLVMDRDPTLPCITDITLWRSADDVEIPDADGWQGNSTDINDGRGGSYLYLAWKYA